MIGRISRMVGRRFIDIAGNLTDPMYQGVYNGSEKHPPDLDAVLERAWDQKVEKIMVTGGSLSDSRAALALAKLHERLFSTVGCHPTRCGEFEAHDGGADAYLEELSSLASENRGKVVAIGEFGLDYDRLQFCPKDIQLKYFEKQLELVKLTGLPMFLHCRNSADDLVSVLERHKDGPWKGVVHSFDGSLKDARAIIDLGLHVGVNGCSLKTKENLEVLKEIPIDRLMVETDCPWCEIRPSHVGYEHVETRFPSRKKEKWESGSAVKARNEPANVVSVPPVPVVPQVVEVLGAVKDLDLDELADRLFENAVSVFFSDAST
ncbi:unnamed protein product [Darwinula stevensoni]|uniref:Deoxyribonuclease TATDN1 n=1 Tax=Darwinula stevensoni TaxID=69355 RepID=A0A7R9AFA3_9CRUS|nr:unnamed protein product [Darwinula stevensoni]CAG0902427.1 unnamed protein product [Darwinula stevensoni]